MGWFCICLNKTVLTEMQRTHVFMVKFSNRSKSLCFHRTSVIDEIQVALAIRSFGIRGYDYSRTQKVIKKPRITGENYYVKLKLGLKQGFWYSRLKIYKERNPRE